MASTSKNSKAANRAAAQRLAQLKAEQRRASRRNTLLAILGALVIIAGFVVLVQYIVGSRDVDFYDSGELTTPPIVDGHDGFLIGQDGTVGGSVPDDAIRVDVYIDPLCPVCHAFEQINKADLDDLRERGFIALYIHPISILDRLSSGTRYSTRASSALATVGQYDSGHFEAFLSALFDHQPEEGSPGLTNAEIADVAREAGVSEDAIAKIAEGEFTQWVTAATNQASIDGLQGTPTVWVERDTDLLDLQGDVWGNAGQLSFTLGFIHENGVQAYRDALAAAQEDQANPSPSASVSP